MHYSGWPGLAIFALICSRYISRSYASSLLKSYRSRSFFTHSSYDFLGQPFFLFPVISSSITLRIWELMSRQIIMTMSPQTTLHYHIHDLHNTQITPKNISRHPTDQSHPKHHHDHTTLHPTQPCLIRNSNFPCFKTLQQNWSNATLIDLLPLLQR